MPRLTAADLLGLCGECGDKAGLDEAVADVWAAKWPDFLAECLEAWTAYACAAAGEHENYVKHLDRVKDWPFYRLAAMARADDKAGVEQGLADLAKTNSGPGSNDWDAYFYLVPDGFVGAGDFDEALKLSRDPKNSKFDHEFVCHHVAVALASRGDFDAAVKALGGLDPGRCTRSLRRICELKSKRDGLAPMAAWIDTMPLPGQRAVLDITIARSLAATRDHSFDYRTKSSLRW